MAKQIVYLDMDGTIADLYGISDWLGKLRREEKNLFLSCNAFITEEDLFKIFPPELFDIRILSMTPKGASEEYCKRVVYEKNVWLDLFFPRITKRIYLKYGNNKNLKNSKNHILIDDNKIIRENFRGIAVEPFWIWG